MPSLPNSASPRASTTNWSTPHGSWQDSLRRGALAPVKADAGTAEHWVLDDRHGEPGILVGPPHTLGKRSVPGERQRELVRDARREACAEQAGSDRQYPDAEAAEIARHREGHPGNAGFGRCVGNLADLPFERGDGSGIDDHAALAVFRLVSRHVKCLQTVQVESPDQVQLNRAPENIQWVRAFPGQGAARCAAARSIDRDV
jgi:hypothetical protein